MIPIDPMTREPVWGMRVVRRQAGLQVVGRQNVYDVYSKSEGTALDGTKYADW